MSLCTKLKLYFLLILFSVTAINRDGNKQKTKGFLNTNNYLVSGSSESLSIREVTFTEQTIIRIT